MYARKNRNERVEHDTRHNGVHGGNMASRSLNLVQLIGNLTRDPELRYIPQGTAVCSFTVATNRSWMPSEGGERREETEYHRIVCWNKLAELCSQLLAKGRKVYVSGRMQTRQWETPDGQTRERTEVVIDDMIILDSRRTVAPTDAGNVSTPAQMPPVQSAPDDAKKEPVATGTSKKTQDAAPDAKDAGDLDAIDVDDIPF